MRSEIAAARDYLIKYASGSDHNDQLLHSVNKLLDYLIDIENEKHNRTNELHAALDDNEKQEALIASLKQQLTNADERANKLQHEVNHRTQQLGAIALILSSRLLK